jgi:succinoglycan biosynthesis transport protein ExoP
MNELVASAPGPVGSAISDRSVSETIDLGHIFLVLWRRKAVVGGTFLAVLALGLYVILQLTPRYSASTTLLLQLKKNTILQDAEATGPVFGIDASAVRSELDVLRSRSLTEKVINKLDLINDPDFNPLIGPPRLGILGRFGLVRPKPFDPQDWPPDRVKALVTDNILDGLSVYNDGKSYTIGVVFEARDPEKAARIINAFSDLYITSELDAKYEATGRTARWLDEKLADLRQRVQSAEMAVQKFREENHIVNLNQGTLTQTQIAGINDQIAQARAARMQAEAALRQVQNAASSPDRTLASPSIANNSVLQGLRQEENTRGAKLAELRSTLGDRHPFVIRAHSELKEIQERLKSEFARTVDGLKTVVQTAWTQEAQLEARAREIQASNDLNNRASVRLHQLESEAETVRLLYDTFLKGFGRTTVQVDAQQPDARILSRAEVPFGSSYPQRTLLFALVMMIATILSLAVTFILEHLDNSYRDPRDIEQRLDTRVLSMVPELLQRHRSWHPSLEVVRQPLSPYSESVRTIRVAMSSSQCVRPPKIILVSAPMPNEGKTSIVLALGRIAAMAGQKALVIEGDLRNPGICVYLGLRPHHDLISVLSGATTDAEAVVIDEETRLHILPVIERNPFPAEMLGSTKMKQLIAQSADNYDLVLIDTPPVNLFSDALILAPDVDATLLVTRWGATPRQLVENAVKRFQVANHPLLGVVMARVDIKRYASYGLGKHPTRYAEAYYAT